jgi:phospholipid-binding lipoprotein MlaA
MMDAKGMFMKAGFCAGRKALLLAFGLVLAGCAAPPMGNPHAQDPWEPLNRSVSSFNDGLDRAVLKPVASAYREITPSPVRTGVHNFFNNLKDVWTIVNTTLQVKPQETVEQVMRVGVNTVLGIYGVLDIASEMNIPRHQEDFGQTLGRWGVPSGPYLVLPVLGPSTLRDSVALFSADRYGDLVQHIDHVPSRNSAYAMRAVDTRMQLLRAEELLDAAALDRYSFVRDSYLQLRNNQIYDGNAPE